MFGNVKLWSKVREHRKSGSILIDVREPMELRQYGMVPEAINIPIGLIDDVFAMRDQEFKAIIGHEKPNIDDSIIFFCWQGIRAHDASNLVYKKYNYSQSFFYPGPFTHLQ